MKKIAILVIAATNQPLYVHYIHTQWTQLIQHTRKHTPHIDVFLLFEHDTDISEFQKIRDNIIQDPLADYSLLCPPVFQTINIPGILSKTVYAFDLLKDQYDVFFRTNLSSLIRLPSLDKFIQEKQRICYSGSWVWDDALRSDLVYYDKIGPGKCIKSLDELERYAGNSFCSGAGYLLSAEEASSLIERKREIRFDIIDDVSVGLMFSSHEILPGFSLDVSPDQPLDKALDIIRTTDACHIRLTHWPLEYAKGFWQELHRDQRGGEKRMANEIVIDPRLRLASKVKQVFKFANRQSLKFFSRGTRLLEKIGVAKSKLINLELQGPENLILNLKFKKNASISLIRQAVALNCGVDETRITMIQDGKILDDNITFQEISYVDDNKLEFLIV
ncbi:MAG: hypothetical protein WBM41_03035 [Arenicellales bacterium]